MRRRFAKAIVLHCHKDAREQIAASLAAERIACIAAADVAHLQSDAEMDEVGAVFVQVPADTTESISRLFCHIRRRCPKSAVVAITPAGDAGRMRAALCGGASDCLDEPVDRAALARCLQAAAGPVANHRSAEKNAESTPRDNLTPLPGHSAFLNVLAGMRTACRRRCERLAILLVDLDRFRECNERHSPAFGDHVLRWMAKLLDGLRREQDIVARYQSDRFIMAMPRAGHAEAAERAEHLRRAMARRPVVFGGAPVEMTASIGVAESTLGFIESEQQLIERARVALAHAKHGGGNRTVTWRQMLAGEPLPELAADLTTERVNQALKRVHEQLHCTHVESTRALVAAVEAKDPYTRAHSLTVAHYAEQIARRLRVSPALLKPLRVAALLHDIGKIGVPDAVLTKPGALTDEEYELIKRHPETAVQILEHVSYLADELPLILHHHERYDGRGYPGGLSGDHIPLGARILAMADSVDAMASPRSYKPAYDVQRVKAEVARGRGTQFDPAVADATLQWLEENPDVLRCSEAPPAPPALA